MHIVIDYHYKISLFLCLSNDNSCLLSMIDLLEKLYILAQHTHPCQPRRRNGKVSAIISASRHNSDVYSFRRQALVLGAESIWRGLTDLLNKLTMALLH
jgi:hypothetical protein